ncbi:hypothetical protein B4O97_04135 [Marispirochaeta aestuarii]|uniref:GmrSD restriction endonucleases N-terminal domain-containing protein n=1 Tax=Marispirochaeta aestuarii TaxID=1963862 RepID=A0A1Y1S1J8_9SPIO|nr:DUF262 domain-containing protein [Marispirochaeta aestuarii]ORC37388.1 hypothetical protein B4O97_04135 [Marispirochaeta aestuarii]
MSIQKYSVNQYTIQTLLTWITSGEIAIPEIQRPFVWSSTQVRDLIDSLYNGFPVGYLIAWRNPNVKLKDGTQSTGKRVLIDGQQRITALMAALLGYEVIDDEYRRVKMTIAFNPEEDRFEVLNPAIKKDNAWISNIADIVRSDARLFSIAKDFSTNNQNFTQEAIFEKLERLKSLVNNHIGLIELNSNLDIQTVTEIFIRINSRGKVLSQADFAMSKIAADEQYGGNELRKCIDYFCHLAVAPEFYQSIKERDTTFAQTEYFQRMQWLKNENDDIYDPNYTDMLRVSFISEFKRGRLEDLVALLSGRNFITRTFEEEIAIASFDKLKAGIMKYMSETNFKRFVMIIRSAGFIDSSMIRSQNALNFAYTLYLTLIGLKENPNVIESLVRRWYVLSVLTGRYSSSPESTMDYDIRNIDSLGANRHLDNIMEAELGDAFWNAGLPQQMNTSVASSPYFKVYLAAQVKMNDKGFLSRDITVRDLIAHRGDVHHLFPKNYLKKRGLNRARYNQIANYVMMQSEINIAIKDRAPSEYFSELVERVSSGTAAYGAITDPAEMEENFRMHCIPDGMKDKDIEHYDDFLEERRMLMAKKIKKYFLSL